MIDSRALARISSMDEDEDHQKAFSSVDGSVAA